MEILTSFNCNRAVKVRETVVPEVVYKFEPRGYKERGAGLYDNVYHVLTNESTGEVVKINVDATAIMKQYEVVEFNGKRHLADLYQAAINAHQWSSHDPERAARVEIHGYEDELNSDIEKIPAEYQDEYCTKFLQWVADILSKESRVASSFVTGPANFNVRRNEKANNSYHKACSDFAEWREKRIKAIERAIEREKPEEQRIEERWATVCAGLDETAKNIKEIDENNAPYHRALFVNSLYGKAETLAKNGEKALLDRYVERIKEWNEKLKKPLFTSRHKFWQLQELCEKKIARTEALAGRENVEIKKDGYTIVKNFAADRLQIIFDGKPDRETISNLKSNGFRWSPSNMAWQRQLTINSYYSASRVVDVSYEELRAAK